MESNGKSHLLIKTNLIVSKGLINVARVQMTMILQDQLEFGDIVVGNDVSLHVNWMNLNNNDWQTTSEKTYSGFILFVKEKQKKTEP